MTPTINVRIKYDDLNNIILGMNAVDVKEMRVYRSQSNKDRAKMFVISNEELNIISNCINHITKEVCDNSEIFEYNFNTHNIYADYLSVENCKGREKYNNCITISRGGDVILIVDISMFKLNCV